MKASGTRDIWFGTFDPKIDHQLFNCHGRPWGCEDQTWFLYRCAFFMKLQGRPRCLSGWPCIELDVRLWLPLRWTAGFCGRPWLSETCFNDSLFEKIFIIFLKPLFVREDRERNALTWISSITLIHHLKRLSNQTYKSYTRRLLV